MIIRLSFLSNFIQIIILAVAIYYLMTFLRGTRALQILTGLTVVVIGLAAASKLLKMDELGWLLARLLPSLSIGLIIVFQQEIRRALAGIGEHRTVASVLDERAVGDFIRAVEYLSEQRIGALIAFERRASLRNFQLHGTELNAPLVGDLLMTIFHPRTPLHDGGVVIRGPLIVAAGCVFPLTTTRLERSAYGTRHRAAIGLSEETDALVVVVSEETGLISIAYGGDMRRGLGLDELRGMLIKTLVAPREVSRGWLRGRRLRGSKTDGEELEKQTGGKDIVAEAMAELKEDAE